MGQNRGCAVETENYLVTKVPLIKGGGEAGGFVINA